MIKPSPGRIVLYRPDGHPPGADPHAAFVAGVLGDRCLNLVVFNETGGMYHAAGAPLLQDDDPAPATGGYAEWMPFQKGQAAKAESAEGGLEAKFDDRLTELAKTMGDRVTASANDVDAKFKSLGDWLQPALTALGKRIDAIIQPSAATPPAPDQAQA